MRFLHTAWLQGGREACSVNGVMGPRRPGQGVIQHACQSSRRTRPMNMPKEREYRHVKIYVRSHRFKIPGHDRIEPEQATEVRRPNRLLCINTGQVSAHDYVSFTNRNLSATISSRLINPSIPGRQAFPPLPVRSGHGGSTVFRWKSSRYPPDIIR